MSVNIFSQCGQTPLRERINEWTLDIPNNKIAGDVRLMNVDFVRYVKGYILGTVPGIVFARMEDTKIYALVLGSIQKGQEKNESKFMKYLNTKSITLDKVIV